MKTNNNDANEETCLIKNKENVKSKRNEPTPLRWLMLILASLLEFINGLQCLQFASFNDDSSQLFQVSPAIIDILTDVYLFAFVISAIPLLLMLRNITLRSTILYFAGFNLLGEILVFIAASEQSLFIFAFIGQFIAGIGQVIALSVPSKLAVTWFPNDELAIATSITLCSYQFGNAIMLLIGTFAAQKSLIDGKSLITDDPNRLQWLSGSISLFSFVFASATFFFFIDRPTSLRFNTTASGHENASLSYPKILIKILRNLHVFSLILSFGLVTGVFTALMAMIAELSKSVFKDPMLPQNVGTVMILSGAILAPLCAKCLDKTKEFRKMFIGLNLCNLSFFSSLTLSIYIGKQSAVWISSALFGVSITSYTVLGMELAAEMTYPETETTSSGLLFTSSSIFSIVLISLSRYFLSFSVLEVDFLLISIFVVALLISPFIKMDLLRTSVENDGRKTDTTINNNI